MNYLSLVFPAAAIILVVLWISGVFPILKAEKQMPETEEKRISRRDRLIILLLTAVYAVVAFTNLGERTAPESFCHFTGSGCYADIEFDRDKELFGLMYYTGLGKGNYYVQSSQDGEEWTDICTLEVATGGMFKWQEKDFDELVTARYLRLITDSEMRLGELSIRLSDGTVLPPSSLSCTGGTVCLFDEQELVPEMRTCLNSSYFDEIYHARTAYENVKNIYPYEISHPPLGKLLISLDIRAFGMNPFGWRFVGTAFGCAMLPFLYLFLKKMFGSTAVSSCGTAIFAFDFMHFTQTRIATIDTYAVFFILLMYLFMYLFVSGDTPSRRKNIYLALSGLSFGLGCACKWTVIYGGAGLALIWLIYWLNCRSHAKKEDDLPAWRRSFAACIGLCIIFFLLVPAVIYYISYYPYGAAKGMSGVSMFFSRDYLDIVLGNQKYMFTYHSGVTASHPYSSRWWQWVLDIRPILYYLNYFPDGSKSSIAAFVNPLLCWGGLAAIIVMAWLALFRRDRQALFIFIGYLSQLIPWMFISRVTFEYHYFPCTVFLTLAVCRIFSAYRRGHNHWRLWVFGFASLCLVLFAAFYPVLSGTVVSGEYTAKFLRWLPSSWPL